MAPNGDGPKDHPLIKDLASVASGHAGPASAIVDQDAAVLR